MQHRWIIACSLQVVACDVSEPDTGPNADGDDGNTAMATSDGSDVTTTSGGWESTATADSGVAPEDSSSTGTPTKSDTETMGSATGSSSGGETTTTAGFEPTDDSTTGFDTTTTTAGFEPTDDSTTGFDTTTMGGETTDDSTGGGSTTGDPSVDFEPILDVLSPPDDCTSWIEHVPADVELHQLAVGTSGHVFVAGGQLGDAWVGELGPSGTWIGSLAFDPDAHGLSDGDEVGIDVATANNGQAFVLAERAGHEWVIAVDVSAEVVSWVRVLDDSVVPKAQFPMGDGILQLMSDVSHIASSPQGRVTVAGFSDTAYVHPKFPMGEVEHFAVVGLDWATGDTRWMEVLESGASLFLSSNYGHVRALATHDERGTAVGINYALSFGNGGGTVRRLPLGGGPSEFSNAPAGPPSAYGRFVGGLDWHGETGQLSAAWREALPLDVDMLVRRFDDQVETAGADLLPPLPGGPLAVAAFESLDTYYALSDGQLWQLDAEGTLTSHDPVVAGGVPLRSMVSREGGGGALLMLGDDAEGHFVRQLCLQDL